MSSDDFHVHGPHDHELEHAAQHGGDDFASRIAVMTAILSTAGALFSYQGGATQNEALMHKNQAAIYKTEAANQWNYYQAKSSKQNLAELAIALTDGDKQAKYQKEVERYKTEKEQIKTQADELEAKVKEEEDNSENAMHLHHRWAQSMMAIQISISLAAITLLTRKNWLQIGALGTAAGGIVLAVAAMLHW